MSILTTGSRLTPYSGGDDQRQRRGTVYSTTVVTLTKVEGSILAELFGGDEAPPGFIDRDGAAFRWVLNYLRSPAGTPTVLPKDESERAQLALEANFYGLPELAALCTTGPPQLAAATDGYMVRLVDECGFYSTNDSRHHINELLADGWSLQGGAQYRGIQNGAFTQTLVKHR